MNGPSSVSLLEAMIRANAFTRFQAKYVDLLPEESKRAVASRDFLIEQIKNQASENWHFPTVTGEFLPYGSFARKTKIRPLNDIDILVVLAGNGTMAQPSSNDPNTWWLKITNPAAPLAAFPDAYGFVNSTKVLNAIKDGLLKVKSYRKADLKKNMQAVVVDLSSYAWNFDVVPAVPIGRSLSEISYYLIPDGTGDWQRTDPRIDSQLIARRHAETNQLFRPLCRLLKYWNNRTSKPVLPSYYFEILVLRVFQNRSITSLKQGILDFFTHAPASLYQACPDPKGLGKNLDVGVDLLTKFKVGSAMQAAQKAVTSAIVLGPVRGMERYELDGWQKVFGPEYVT